MSLFLAADACLSWSLPSVTEQQVSPHRLPMQYWLLIDQTRQTLHFTEVSIYIGSLTNALSKSSMSLYEDDHLRSVQAYSYIAFQTIKLCKLTLMHYLSVSEPTSCSLTVMSASVLVVFWKKDPTMPTTLLINGQPCKYLANNLSWSAHISSIILFLFVLPFCSKGRVGWLVS